MRTMDIHRTGHVAHYSLEGRAMIRFQALARTQQRLAPVCSANGPHYAPHKRSSCAEERFWHRLIMHVLNQQEALISVQNAVRWVPTWHVEDTIEVPGHGTLILFYRVPIPASQVLQEPRYAALLCLPHSMRRHFMIVTRCVFTTSATGSICFTNTYQDAVQPALHVHAQAPHARAPLPLQRAWGDGAVSPLAEDALLGSVKNMLQRRATCRTQGYHADLARLETLLFAVDLFAAAAVAARALT
jgi:hypothetical protein